MTSTDDMEPTPQTQVPEESPPSLSSDQHHSETITLDPKQLEAINAACDMTKRIVSVTGAAGSGKTTIMRKTYDALVAAGYTVALCAPTGKAAKRVYEATGIDAMTIHRLLEYSNPGEPDPRTGKVGGPSFPNRRAGNPLEEDIILADEYAMVNWEVHRSLLGAFKTGACLRVFGDNNQLQPIEEDKKWDAPDEPSPFTTLLANPKFTSIRLDTIHRHGTDSGILLNLQLILRGRMPSRNDQWALKFTDRPVDALRELVLEGLDDGIDFSSNECQIISLQHKSWIGTGKLNSMMQGMFRNSINPAQLLPRHPWVMGENDEKGGYVRMYVGDKVIITRNNYDLAVFNGETGKIIEFSDDGEVVIDLGDREVLIPPTMLVVNRWGKTVEVDPRKDIDLAYVITTHKSQGSEYRRVVYMLNRSTAFMQNRRNFYTACSRGREHVTVITDQQSIGRSLQKLG